jgi:hypothetical protein
MRPYKGSGKSPGLNQFAFSGLRLDYFVVLKEGITDAETLAYFV